MKRGEKTGRKRSTFDQPLKKGASLFGLAVVVSSVAIPSLAEKVQAASTTKEKQQDATSAKNKSEHLEDQVVLPPKNLAKKTVQQWTTSSLVSKRGEAKVVALANSSSFLTMIVNQAQIVANANDLYASVMIAQAILESGWGTSSLSAAPNYNLFGIKGTYNGQSITMRTAENKADGTVYYVNDKFRKYPSYIESFQDNANVLRTTSFSTGIYYYAGAWKTNAKTYKDATKYLTGRYATDVSYNTKLNSIIERYNLTQYDTPTSGGSTGGYVPVDNTTSDTASTDTSTIDTSTSTSGQSYIVKSGDTLYAISSKYGMSVATLKSLNGLTSDTIFVNQQLKVAGSSGSSANTSSTNTSSANTTTTTTSGTTYTVQAGDTLSAIARKYGTSVAALQKNNSLTGTTIYVGQTLAVNTSTSSATTTTSKASTTSNSTANATTNTTTNTTTTSSYSVKSGDTLYAIGAKHGVSVANLKAWNHLTSDTIYVGQALVVKSGTTAATTATKASTTSTTTTSTANTTSNSTANTTTTSSYSVKSGDTLYAIGAKHGVSVANLKAWNHLTSDTIYVGQALVVKSGTTAATTATKTPTTTTTTTTTNKANTASSSPASATATSSYSVKSGDTLYAISTKHGVSVANLKAWNHLTSDTIYVGQTLALKGGTSTAAAKTVSPAATTAKTTTTTPAKATTAATTTTAATNAEETYTVKSGDTQYSIAKKHGITLQQLKTWNKLTNDNLAVGQQLKVKESTDNATATYTVKSGDTQYSIAKKHAITLQQLKTWNKLTSDALNVGQTLRVK